MDRSDAEAPAQKRVKTEDNNRGVPQTQGVKQEDDSLQFQQMMDLLAKGCLSINECNEVARELVHYLRVAMVAVKVKPVSPSSRVDSLWHWVLLNTRVAKMVFGHLGAIEHSTESHLEPNEHALRRLRGMNQMSRNGTEPQLHLWVEENFPLLSEIRCVTANDGKPFYLPVGPLDPVKRIADTLSAEIGVTIGDVALQSCVRVVDFPPVSRFFVEVRSKPFYVTPMNPNRETVAKLLPAIRCNAGLDKFAPIVVCGGGKPIPNDTPLTDVPSSITAIHQPKSGFPVFVKTVKGKTVTLYVSNQDTVAALKAQLEPLTGTPVCDQRLVFSSHQLEDFRMLGDYALQTESTIHMVIRLRGC